MTGAPGSVYGRYYDGRTAAATDIVLWVDDYGVLHLDPPLRAPVPIKDVSADTRIAGVPLSLRYSDDALLELAHTARHAAWIDRHFQSRGCIAKLEGSTRAIVASVMAVAALAGATAVWGVPALSEFVAGRLPRNIAAPMAVDTLRQLDRYLFKPTALGQPRRSALAARFATLLPPSVDLVYRLEFRGGGMLGPNAIALPDGTIVVTDELVGIADHDDEIAAVLLHEIGHVEHRHSLRQLLSHAGLATMAGLVFGDVQAISGVLLAMPGMLMENAYSRDLEWEADSYALGRLEAVGLSGANFTTLLGRLERCADVTPDDKQSFVDACRARLQARPAAAAQPDAASSTNWHPYLSTHPATDARLRRFKAADVGR